MRYRFQLKSVLTVIVAMLLFAIPSNAADDPVTVFTAKKIITMDPGLPEATAV